MPHANFAEDVSGGRILPEVRGKNAIQLGVLKSMTHHCLGRFCGISISPVGNANPIAQFSAPMFHLGMEPDAAAKASVAAQPNRQTKSVLFRHAGKKFAGVGSS